MPQKGTIFRVLVASPSDCIGERKLIPDVIYGWNAAHSFPLAAVLEPVLWETHARPELGDRPQGLINKQLVDNCDILIGTFWTRLGTSTGKAESGTAEEIEEFRSKGKRVLVYFSSAPVVPESLDIVQYQLLTEYKKKLGAQGLYFQYDALDSLRDLLQRHIAGAMAELHQRVPSEDEPPAKAAKNDDLQQYRSQVDSFLRRLDAEWASERDSGPHGIDEGKVVIANALNQVIGLRTQIARGMDDIANILDNAAKDFRGLQRHRLFLDGGRSYRAFWQEGDEAISRLKVVSAILSKYAGEDGKDGGD